MGRRKLGDLPFLVGTKLILSVEVIMKTTTIEKKFKNLFCSFFHFLLLSHLFIYLYLFLIELYIHDILVPMANNPTPIYCLHSYLQYRGFYPCFPGLIISKSLFYGLNIRTGRRHVDSQERFLFVCLFGLGFCCCFLSFSKEYFYNIYSIFCDNKNMHARFFFCHFKQSILEYVDSISLFQFCRGLSVDLCIKALIQSFFKYFSIP